MLKLEELSFSYGDKVIFENINLELPSRGIVALMGASGCGKSTLFSVIAGVLSPTSGRVTADGILSISFQEPRLLPHMTAEENIRFVLGKREDAHEISKKILADVGLADSADKYPSELSGGMQKRVSLARALAYGGDIILLDEPFAGVDEERKKELTALVKRTAENALVFMTSHDRAEVEACADRIIMFDEL